MNILTTELITSSGLTGAGLPQITLIGGSRIDRLDDIRLDSIYRWIAGEIQYLRYRDRVCFQFTECNYFISDCLLMLSTLHDRIYHIPGNIQRRVEINGKAMIKYTKNNTLL